MRRFCLWRQDDRVGDTASRSCCADKTPRCESAAGRFHEMCGPERALCIVAVVDIDVAARERVEHVGVTNLEGQGVTGA